MIKIKVGQLWETQYDGKFYIENIYNDGLNKKVLILFLHDKLFGTHHHIYFESFKYQISKNNFKLVEDHFIIDEKIRYRLLLKEMDDKIEKMNTKIEKTNTKIKSLFNQLKDLEDLKGKYVKKLEAL